MAWEKTSLDVARAVGLAVPVARLLRIGSDSVLLLERFDREGSLMNGPRIPYLSAMSLVGARDGLQCDYADVADALVDWCRDPLTQLESLFTRVALSIALHNTDDHLRNLGLLRKGGSWVLSPVFDVNINPDPGKQRVTSVFGETGRSEIDGLRELAEACGLTAEKSATAVARVVGAARLWRSLARRNGCKEAEGELMGRVVDERVQALNEAFS
ncbi:HipA-like N-terminal domain-containing protein [Olsenella sp. kh2p3]|nr:HipA-like N-terminal domain-containing protein [Olsenella sp. kh2p3]